MLFARGVPRFIATIIEKSRRSTVACNTESAKDLVGD